MAETLVQFQVAIAGSDGQLYRVRACGAPTTGGLWEGWLEFEPERGGDTVRSQRETTQPNRVDSEYWATGLTRVYLEGALRRALAGPIVVPVETVAPPAFDGPAPALARRQRVPAHSVLDPFSVFTKGEGLLRQQLTAFSAPHLVNIVVDYELSDLPLETLNAAPPGVLIDIIVTAVREAYERGE